jgi:hypothetical protein
MFRDKTVGNEEYAGTPMSQESIKFLRSIIIILKDTISQYS